MRAPPIFISVLPLIAVLITGCGGPSTLAYMRGCYFEQIGNHHLSAEDPLTDAGRHEYIQAIDQFTAAIKLRPRFIDAVRHRGVCNWRILRNQQALQDLSQAIALSPNDYEVWKERAYVWRESENYDKAAEDFAAALRLDGDDTSSWLGRAECELMLDETDRCFADLNRAQALDPKDSDVYCTRAAAYRKRRSYKKMEAEYRVALDLNPHDPEVYQRRAYARFIIGRYEQAAGDFDSVIRLTDWRFRSASYSVILAALSCRMLGRQKQAKEWLDAGVTAFRLPLSAADDRGDARPASQWPQPAIQFLRGDITADKLIECANRDRDKLTEAYCYLALDAQAAGKKEIADRYFNWVIDHGSKNFVEHEIAEEQAAARRPAKASE